MESSNDKAKELWNDKHILKIQDDKRFREINISEDSKDSKDKEFKKRVEPWLSALFQSEHLSLLVGSGISLALNAFIKNKNENSPMSKMNFSVFEKQIKKATAVSAKNLNRGDENIEDQIRVANDLLQGLKVYTSEDFRGAKKIKKDLEKFEEEINSGINNFVKNILEIEKNIINPSNSQSSEYLLNFVLSFAIRSATKERLNIFTTNYDRIMEFGAELAGIRLIDRFIGNITPIFRSSRLEVDMHYNPPGIRGEPRYLEGVTHFTKLHGSIDWIYQNGYVRRISVPFGADNIESYFPEDKNILNAHSLMIYPNSSKDRETSEYPYVDLFRDFSSAVCRPNSTVILYGYGFGDDHINRVLIDMLTIPSTHLVIISYNDEGHRIHGFYKKAARPVQISLLIGKHFGDLKTLVDHYLPKPAIDRTILKMVELLKARGIVIDSDDNNQNKESIE